MSDEILVNVTPQETRIAIVENGLLQEVYIERSSRRGLVGNIYKGSVQRVLPGMQAAFVDLNLARTAFLHESDIRPVYGENGVEIERDINAKLREGQEVLVQVIKDPLGTKGARLTTQISIPSRYLVYMPGANSDGISQKIEDEEERVRLKTLMEELRAEDGESGFIVRTAAEGASRESVAGDRAFLKKVWGSIQKTAANAKPATLVREAMPLVIAVLRDLPEAEIYKVRIDSREAYRMVMNFVETFIPQLLPRIEHYPGERPIFDLYSVEDEINRALSKRVQLKSGGYLYIEQTEAMVTVDVNTGTYVGQRNLEETIFKTNLEAAQAIGRQLRLRNLGGIIILDFIDMKESAHKEQVLRALSNSMKNDRARHHICDVSPLGLVEMTRERTRESLGHILCEPCAICGGQGVVKTLETICYEIFRELLREARQFDVGQYLILAAVEVVDRLLEEESNSVAELEAFIGRPIKLQAEPLYAQDQFDVVPM
ncbi:MAG: ribonuclease G [Gammaproteobacteria bacterium]|nr:ribonuclease G [Gammaproteobacteria bacterium]